MEDQSDVIRTVAPLSGCLLNTLSSGPLPMFVFYSARVEQVYQIFEPANFRTPEDLQVRHFSFLGRIARRSPRSAVAIHGVA